VQQAELRYMQNVSSLKYSTETDILDCFYNACQLRPADNKDNFHKVMKYLDKKQAVSWLPLILLPVFGVLFR